jgi:hypothetical protein
MVRTVKVSTGVKRIEDQNHSTALLKLREMLSDERRILITRIETDLNAYIGYRFSKKANANQLERIKAKLHLLKNANVDLDHYGTIVQDFFRQENTYISSEPFYREIDECLTEELTPQQLNFVN